MEKGTARQIAIASDHSLRLLHDMASLGVTPESLRNTPSCQEPDDPRVAFEPLTDPEWDIIGPLLPPEPRQMNTMNNREFINAVLIAMHRGGRWNAQLKTGSRSDAVRRRFGRWAHQRIWQGLEQHLAGLSLPVGRKKAFEAMARRATQLARTA